MIRVLTDPTSEEGLKKMVLFKQETRKLQGDFIEAFQYLNEGV